MTITVFGQPAPKGSKKAVGRRKNGSTILVESSAKVKPWAEACKWAAIQHDFGAMLGGPVTVEVDFYFQHPKSGKRRAWHAVKPDIDKLQRSTFDALKDAGVFEDDSRIVAVTARKHYSTADSPVPAGAVITIEKATVYE